jgi:hypothetical protein
MPLVTALNLRADDRWPEVEAALSKALTSMPELAIEELGLILKMP